MEAETQHNGNGATMFGLRPEDIAKLAAEKLADEAGSAHDFREMADTIIRERIDALFKATINQQVETALAAKLEEAMNQAIQPVDIWGEKVGEPTTIRDALNTRAKEFWNTLVDASGNTAKADYYNRDRFKTRAEWMLGKIVSEKFAEEVKQNAVNILAVFKEKIRADGHAALDKHIDELVRVKSR